jgi:hypothetical protein
MEIKERYYITPNKLEDLLGDDYKKFLESDFLFCGIKKQDLSHEDLLVIIVWLNNRILKILGGEI